MARALATALAFAVFELVAFLLPAFLPTLHARVIVLSLYSAIHFVGGTRTYSAFKRANTTQAQPTGPQQPAHPASQTRMQECGTAL